MDNKWLIVGAGPSLLRSDVELLRGCYKTVAVNCAIFFTPWADVLFAWDKNWWEYYGPKVAWFKGLRVSGTSYRGYDVRPWRRKGWARTGGNSGHVAIQYAVDHGGQVIYLLGFDHQKTNGQAHCHPDHPLRNETGLNMGNADGVEHWPRAMELTAIELQRRKVQVINLSRTTAITNFPRLAIEQLVEIGANA